MQNRFSQHEGDPTKLCFLAQRSEVNSRTRHAVDIRYSKSFILRMERLLGHTWLSTGGESTTRVNMTSIVTIVKSISLQHRKAAD